MSLDYSDYVNIKITRVQLDGQPSHWEYTLDSGAGGTGPTFYGVLDMAIQSITGDTGDFDSIYNDWVDFDANKED